MQKLVLSLIAVLATSAHAKTYLDEAKGRALVYYFQGDNVNASVCEPVTEQELRAAMPKDKCKPLSENGLSKADVEKKLPAFKAELIKAIGGLADTMGSTIGGISQDKKGSDFISDFFTTFANRQKAAIEALTPDAVFKQLELDARIPTLDKVKASDDLDSEIEQFALLTSK